MKALKLFWALLSTAHCQHQGGLPRTDANGDVWQICTKCAHPHKLNVNLKVSGAIHPALRAG